MVTVTAIGRCRRGTNSAASAAAFGIAPPSPIPASSRSHPSAAGPLADAAASVIAPNTAMLARSAVRRPNRSPAIPASAPPVIIPRYPSDTNGANAPRGTVHSRIKVGITMPSSWLSMPSKTTVMAVRNTSHCWYGPQGAALRTLPTSTGLLTADCRSLIE
jgi:hypothetical protein